MFLWHADNQSHQIFCRVKHELAEQKAKLSNERRKYQTLYTSFIAGSMTNGLTTSQFPPPNYRPPSPIVMTALSPHKAPEMMSTPRKGMTDPVLSQVKSNRIISHKIR